MGDRQNALLHLKWQVKPIFSNVNQAINYPSQWWLWSDLVLSDEAHISEPDDYLERFTA